MGRRENWFFYPTSTKEPVMLKREMQRAASRAISHKCLDFPVSKSIGSMRYASSTSTTSTEEDKKAVERRIFAQDHLQDGKTLHRTQYNTDPFSGKPELEHYNLPLVDAQWLARQKERPRRVRMLARDFIHDSLYNPHYGYFSRHAVLLPESQRLRKEQGLGFDFQLFSDEREFMIAVEERYVDFEESMQESDASSKKAQDEALERKLDDTLKPLLRKKQPLKAVEEDRMEGGKSRSRLIPFSGTAQGMDAAQRKGRIDLARQLLNEKERSEHDRDVKAMAARQVWHTPTELFKPHYAHAVARYMVEMLGDGEQLVVYEVGAGSGALASDILGYVHKNRPDLYENMQYRIVEISQRLAQQQGQKLQVHIAAGKATIEHKSILQWEEAEGRPCFFIAMEVLDNLTHDVVRFASDSLLPYQALVSIDAMGDLQELYEPVSDDKIRRCLQQCSSGTVPAPAPRWMSYMPSFVRSTLARTLPFYPNLTKPQFLPTGSLQLLDVLSSKFPKHKLIASDFKSLPDTIEGISAPVVQTRLNGTIVAVSKFTVLQGFFDIFFPTDFALLQRMHSAASGQKGGTSSSILSHRAFLQKYGDAVNTKCKDGSNPMLSWYSNASWFLTR